MQYLLLYASDSGLRIVEVQMGEKIRSEGEEAYFALTDSVERLGPGASVYGVVGMSGP